MTSPKKNPKPARSATAEARPFTETIEIAHGPNVDGLGHQTIAAQSLDDAGAPILTTAEED